MASGSLLYKITGRTLEEVILPPPILPLSPTTFYSNLTIPIPVPRINIPVPVSIPPDVNSEWEWVQVGGIGLDRGEYVRVPVINSGFDGISIPSPP
jgi:hypothetical protein